MKVEAGINNYRIENCGDYNNIRMNVVFSLDSNLKINLADKVEIDVPVSHNLEKYSNRDLEMELERRKLSDFIICDFCEASIKRKDLTKNCFGFKTCPYCGREI